MYFISSLMGAYLLMPNYHTQKVKGHMSYTIITQILYLKIIQKMYLFYHRNGDQKCRSLIFVSLK